MRTPLAAWMCTCVLTSTGLTNPSLSLLSPPDHPPLLFSDTRIITTGPEGSGRAGGEGVELSGSGGGSRVRDGCMYAPMQRVRRACCCCECRWRWGLGWIAPRSVGGAYVYVDVEE